MFLISGLSANTYSLNKTKNMDKLICIHLDAAHFSPFYVKV